MAAQIYEEVLERHPNHPDALHLLGTVALAGSQVSAAINLMSRAAANKPKDPVIRLNLANALLQADDVETAESHLRRALKIQPNFPGALCFLADCRAASGDGAEARRIYDDVLARWPDHPQGLIGYADLLVSLGDIDQAKSLFRRALALGIARPSALAGIASSERLAEDSPEAAEILSLLGTPGLAPADYVNLSYAAGRIAEAAGDYDAAFGHFTEAKSLSGRSFDSAAQASMFAGLKAGFTSDFFAAQRKSGSQTSRPVFIVGMPRSGTTLVEQIISRHPDVAAGGERPDIARIAASLGLRADDAKPLVKRLSKITPSEMKATAARYLAMLDGISPTALRVTDKMPHNFQHLGLIALLFPNARIIHIRRNALDNCVSCFTTQLKDNSHGYAADLETLGFAYRQYDALMRHWRAVLPLPIHELDYEALIASPEEQSRRLVDFIGLPWDPACLAPEESTRAVTTQSRMQVRRPVYATSVGRWRRYERHLEPLRAALGDLVAPSSTPSDSVGGSA